NKAMTNPAQNPIHHATKNEVASHNQNSANDATKNSINNAITNFNPVNNVTNNLNPVISVSKNVDSANDSPQNSAKNVTKYAVLDPTQSPVHTPSEPLKLRIKKTMEAESIKVNSIQYNHASPKSSLAPSSQSNQSEAQDSPIAQQIRPSDTESPKSPS